MRKIYEHADFTMVGYYQTVLEEAGILTLVKNVGASIGTGEIPFTEVYPELWVMEDAEYDRAESLLRALREEGPPESAAQLEWTCPNCGEKVEGNFGECWNCGTDRPESP